MKNIPLVAAIVFLAAGGFLILRDMQLFSPAPQGVPRGVLTSEGQIDGKTSHAGYVYEQGGLFYVRRVAYSTGEIQYETQPLSEVDLKTFTVLPQTYPADSLVLQDFAKDKNHIWYEGEIVQPPTPEAAPIDVATFKLLSYPYNNFAEDKRAVYVIDIKYDGNFWAYYELPGIDPATFTFVGSGDCAKDKNGFYTIDYYSGELTKTNPIEASLCVHPSVDEESQGI